MMQKKDFNKKIKKMFVTKGTDPVKVELTPYRDWRRVVGVFFVAIFVSLGLNAYLFVGVNEDNFFGGAFKKEEVATFDKEKLLKVLETFRKKEEAVEALKKTPTPVVDPSL